MKDTVTYLLAKGIVLQSDAIPTVFALTRENLVREAVTTLLRKDFATQDITGRYTDRQFETLSIAIDPNNFRTIDEQQRQQHDTLGWVLKKKVRMTSRVDEVCAIMSFCSTIGSAPVSPSDVTMNCFRYYDVLRLILGDSFDLAGSLEINEDLPSLNRWARFKYINFIATQLKPFLRSSSLEDIIGALYTMQLYQFIPCLVAAFRLREREAEWNSIGISYPILEQRNWTDTALDDLLKTARVKDTLEWVKVMPLVTHEDEFLNSTLDKAVLLVPFEESDLDRNEKMKAMKYLDVGPTLNFAITDEYGSFYNKSDSGSFFQIWAKLFAIDNQTSYLLSYNVTIKGYYMAEENMSDERDLAYLYDELVKPWFWTSIKSSIEDQDPKNTVQPSADLTKMNRNFGILSTVIDEAEKDIFEPILDFTARRTLLASSMKMDGKILPLYYALSSGGEITFSNE